jgi:hypothetical protein
VQFPEAVNGSFTVANTTIAVPSASGLWLGVPEGPKEASPLQQAALMVRAGATGRLLLITGRCWLAHTAMVMHCLLPPGCRPC